MSAQIRVLIADDHTIVRSGVRLLLEAEADMQVVGEARDGKEAITLAGTLRPHVVLMDVAMPDLDGMEATRQIKAQWPEISILALTMHRSDEYFFAMLRAGASGYVLKGADATDLIQAVRIVSRGEVFLYPTMAERLVHDFLSRSEHDLASDLGLSPREQEVLELLAKGYSGKEIADQLFVSPSTVHSHRSNLMRKLGLSTRHELIQFARQHGLL